MIVWLAGATYCHGYQYFLTGEQHGHWSGSLMWSAIAVVPWFALFEWSKEPQGVDATRRPATLLALVLGIAGLSISLESVVDFCVGDVTDQFGLLVMRRLPAIGVSVLLIALTRKAAMRRPPNPANVELHTLAGAIDWVEAADNYVELHVGGRTVMRRMTMRDAEQALRGRGFVRIHRRFPGQPRSNFRSRRHQRRAHGQARLRCRASCRARVRGQPFAIPLSGALNAHRLA